jgi:hypothetical protein
MFMYLALHNTHSPIEAPDSFISKYHFNNSEAPRKNTFFAMVSVDRSLERKRYVGQHDSFGARIMGALSTSQAPITLCVEVKDPIGKEGHECRRL